MKSKRENEQDATHITSHTPTTPAAHSSEKLRLHYKTAPDLNTL